MSLPSAKISIIDPKFGSPYLLDASPFIKAGQYAQDGNGCAAGSLTTTLTWEQIESKGWGLGRNGVEISTYDGDSLQAASGAGATKLYVLSTKPYDPAVILETAQIAIDDGFAPCYFIPVTGVGTDGGGPYITVGAPLHGAVAGNPVSIPAYGAGARIYRRRWAGRIAQRTRDADRTKKATLVLQGIGHRLQEILGNFAFNAYDCGQALYQTIANCSAQFTDLAISSMVSVTIGQPFTGNYQNAFVSDVLNNVLSAIPGDIWTVRLGADRIPRILKLYTSSTQVYTYTKTFSTTQLLFVPLDVESVDQDTSQMANEVLVVGDTDPQTQNAVQAVAADVTSQGTYLEIDAAPYAATGVKDQTTAAAFASALLQQKGYPQAQHSLKLAIENGNTASGIASSQTGLPEGDQVYGFESITVAGINQQSDSSNACPDSGMQYVTGPLALWGAGGGTIVAGGSPDGQNAISLSAAGVSQGPLSPKILASPFQTWTFTGYIDPSAVTGTGGSGIAQWFIGAYDASGNYLGNVTSANATLGAAAGTPTAVTFTTPASTASIIAFPYVQGAGTRSGNVKFAQPNLSRGSTIKPYVANLAAANIYGLPSSVTSSFVAGGDRVQMISFAPVVPNVNAIAQERANAALAAVLANTVPSLSISSYCVSPNANQFTFSSSSLVLTFPAIVALFAQGSNLISVATANLTLPASATTWVWLQPSGSYLLQGSQAKVAGAIFMGYFTTSATGIVGTAFRAVLGVIQIGVGNINLASNLPAPTFGTPTVTNGALISGLAAAVDVSVPLTNVPTDGSAGQVIFYYRQSASAGGSGAWIPSEAQNLTLAAGTRYPTAAQTQTWEYDVNNGSTYDFAIGYVGLAGYGPLTVFRSGFVVAAIAIPNAYMLATSFTPTVSGVTITPYASTGVTATTALSFTITQPTDGSLSRVSFFVAPAGSGNYGYVASVPAKGALSLTPPASGAYSNYQIPNLVNGQAYDFAIALENAAGGEGPITYVGTSTAQLVAITSQYLIVGQVGAVTPTVTAQGAGIGSAATLAGVASRVALNFNVTNQPTDGSFAGVVIYQRRHGAPTNAWSPQIFLPSSTVGSGITPVASGTYYVEIPEAVAGVAYDFAITLESTSGAQGTLVAPTFMQNYTPQAIAIANAYMLAGTTFTPAISGVTITPYASTGVNATTALSFVTTQPTDGSLSRISFFVAPAGSGNYGYVASIPASGAGSLTPPASGSYSNIQIPNLTNGQAYDFAIALENAQGGEGAITYVGTSTAVLIAITTQYLISGSTATVTPTVAAVGAGIGSAPTLQGVASRVALNFSISNQPTDGSFAGVVVYQRQHGAPTASWSPQIFLPSTSIGPGVSPSASGTYYVELPEAVAGIAYDFAVALENTRGAQGTLVAPSFMQNYTAQTIAITNGYMIGTSLTPVVASVTTNNGTSADGVNAAVATAFTLTNQPTDGSLSRVQIWVRVSSAGGSNTVGAAGFAWSPYGSQQAVGVGTSSPPASAAYAFTLADITNGNVIDIGVSYENAQGGESTLAVVTSSFSANALNIPPGATSFSNLLTSSFLGLAVDTTTGYLTMPAVAEAIYPSAQQAVLGPYLGVAFPSASSPGNLTFAMRFQLTNATANAANFVSASIFTSASIPGTTFANGYYIKYVAGAPATITLAKIVSGSSTAMLSRSAAIAASGIYPAQPAIPNSDTYFHELRVVAIPYNGSLVPQPGTTIQIYLDGNLVAEFGEGTTTSAVSNGPSIFNYGGNVGGVAPFTSGTVGPGSGGYALVYLDPSDLILTGIAAVNAQAIAQQQGAITKSQSQQLKNGSPTPLAASVVARESQMGTTGHGTNQIFNPSFLRGRAGWSTVDTTGGLGVATTDSSNGGRLIIALPVGTYPAANATLEIYQYLTSTPLASSTTYTVSGFIQLDSQQAGGYANVSVQQLPTGTTGVTSASLLTAAAGSPQFFTFTFTTGSAAVGTGSSAPFIACAVISGTPATTTVATTGEFYKLMLETGSVATTHADSVSSALVTLTHSATAGAEGSYLNAGQISARHMYGGNASDSGAMVDGTSKLLYARHATPVTASLTSTPGSDGSYHVSQSIFDRHIAASVPRKNLVVNGNNSSGSGSVAPSTFGWPNSYNSTAVAISGGTYAGFATLEFIKTSTASAQGFYQDVPVTPGQTYTFSTLVFAGAAGMTPTMWIGKSDYSVQYNVSPGAPVNTGTFPAFYASATSHANAFSTTAANSVWVHLYGTFTIPSGVISVRVLIYDSSTTASQAFYAAGIMLSEGARLQDYVDHEGNVGSIANRHLSAAMTLDGVNDGGTYQRMPIANMDANRRGIIDYSQAHVNNPFSATPNGSLAPVSLYLPAGTGGLFYFQGKTAGSFNPVVTIDAYGDISCANVSGAVLSGTILNQSAGGDFAKFLTLAAGVSPTWTFNTPYNNRPVPSVTALGAPPSGASTELYVTFTTGTGGKYVSLVVNSTSSTDARTVGVVLIGNPN